MGRWVLGRYLGEVLGPLGKVHAAEGDTDGAGGNDDDAVAVGYQFHLGIFLYIKFGYDISLLLYLMLSYQRI